MEKIMTMGEILVEIMATERGQSLRAPGRLLGPYASGAPAIFIDQVARLGHPAAIIACVGDDDFGWLNIERLQRDGVDTGSISVLPDAVTGSAFVTYRRNGERDFIFNITNSACAQLQPAHVNAAALRDCAHFHVMGSSLFSFRLIDAMKKAIDIVKGQGGTVSFDPNIRKEMLRIAEMREALTYILEFTDILLPSEHELSLLANAPDEAGAVRELFGKGVKEIVVKHGAQGCCYFAPGVRFALDAIPVEELDPTGAGDCFGATFVTCRRLGKTPDESLRYANASGALAVGAKGPMEGTSGFKQLDALLALS
ncbi:sugar kinase [Verminephrobacter aporrectodeae subsp. tuberculatae]|uniref:tagatose kinase n=1 Tax=Verminephrobacter aporrectodeae TaxID=1110389 RepID=UPI000237824A|nr:sugar kinase [Verminephrobacter aporrectodeae]MCW8166457.1 sugar kinase [Verminephrobacter aporrectodeae subsp. tuberculatae]MCW8170520.1 sugar kinase [Verminephrobacter aporrectodeae subsp. tuberculatae]MCW8198234.1 sugar kinase [Verminephrobacter aporrectodeae subsp. tuberculatae]MCW8207147.1 sugar kinase [Verminephrobacter aporrectodeae subsp. tuberculatae]